MRILGGSLGISMSTALVDQQVRKHLSGLTPDEQSAIESDRTNLSTGEKQALATAYSNAFHDGMLAAVAVSGVAVLLTLGSYRRGGRRVINEQRQALMADEMRRRAVQRGASVQDSREGSIGQDGSAVATSQK